MTPISKNFSVGPSGRAIRGTFKEATNSKCTEYGSAFYSISTRLHQKIKADPEQRIIPQDGKKSAADKYMKQKSHLLICSALDTHAGRITAVYSESPAFGSSWVPIQVELKDQAKALAAYLNSTIGILNFLNRRSKKLTFAKFSIAHQAEFLIPDLTGINPEPLLEAFEKIKHIVLLPFCKIPNDPARQILDRAAAKILDIPYSEIQEWGRILAAEPTICNTVAEQS